MTLNSDDPPMFGTTLTDEYRRAASVLGLGPAQLAGLAANGVQASFLDSGAERRCWPRSAPWRPESGTARQPRAFPRKRPPEPATLA